MGHGDVHADREERGTTMGISNSSFVQLWGATAACCFVSKLVVMASSGGGLNPNPKPFGSSPGT